MSDVFDAEARSAIMARVRSRGNSSTEIRLVTLMKQAGIHGWRRGIKLLGKPDFVFRAQKLAVFADGCFWHGCPRCGKIPRTNASYWATKISRNKARDRTVTRALRDEGWRVIRIWECALSAKRQAVTLRRLCRALT